MNKEQVLDLMKSSKNPYEWNNNCNIIKKAHDGDYPSYWYSEIILSGLMDKTLGAGSSTITIKTEF